MARTRTELEGLIQDEFGLERVRLEEPKSEEFGDYTANAGFLLAKKLKLTPGAAAERVAKALEQHPDVAHCEAVQGFVNIWLTEDVLARAARALWEDPGAYISSDMGRGKKLLYEFVSANPTGPLNVVSARAAAVGDSLVRIARACGFRAEAEYYANDAGGQVRALGESIAWRLGQREAPPEDGYLGEYLVPVAQRLRGAPRQEYGPRAAEMFLEEHMKVLARFGVRFDRVVKESEIRASEYPQRLWKLLEGNLRESEDKAVFLAGDEIGDEKDRVLKRRTGEPTYLFWDMAYHLHKRDRAYDAMVNLLGPDHHSYAKTITLALKKLGIENLRVKIIQQVHLIRGGQRVKMSKRRGQMYTMEELLEEVGPDAARFFLLARSTSQPLDFDLDLAKTLAQENPVYYVQYVHARCCSLERFAREEGVEPEGPSLRLLTEPQERSVMRKLLYLPDVVEASCRAEEPHLLVHYLLELAGLFHGYYQKHRVITRHRERSRSRLALVLAVRAAIREGLKLLGVSAPERM